MGKRSLNEVLDENQRKYREAVSKMTIEERLELLERTVISHSALINGLIQRTLENAKLLDEGIAVVGKIAEVVQEVTDVPIIRGRG